jgi:DNA-binding SARP family transcriptional activator
MVVRSSEARPAGTVQLKLLGGFDLVVDGESVTLGLSSQRLLSLLAMRHCPMTRVQVAGTLWPDVAATRANANLRSAVWRIQRSCPDVVNASFQSLCLGTHIVVDFHEWAMLARRVINLADEMNEAELGSALNGGMHIELLPELGDEEWLVGEREHNRQLTLHALEALSERFVGIGWFGAAVETALTAVRIDPLRESAQRALVRAYLAEGNVCDARRQYRGYRRLLHTELGVRPSHRFDQLIAEPEQRPAPASGRLRRVSHDRQALPAPADVC